MSIFIKNKEIHLSSCISLTIKKIKKFIDMSKGKTTCPVFNGNGVNITLHIHYQLIIILG